MIWLALLLACGGPKPDPTGYQPPDPILALADAGPPVVAYVGETISFSGGASTGISFQWTFGDGSGSPAANDPRVQHAYSAPGHYTALISALGSDGVRETDTVAVTVTWPEATVTPNTSSTMAATADHVIAVQPDHDTLAVVSRGTKSVFAMSTCNMPRSVSASDTLIAVACEKDEARLYDTDFTELARIDFAWGSRPFGIVVTPDDAIAVTLQGTGQVAWIDTTGITALVDVGPDLRGLAATENGLIVSRHRSPDDQGELWYLADTGQFSWTLEPDPGPDSDTDARGVPTYLQRIVVRPDGRTAVVGGLKANIGRGITRDTLELTHETTTRAVVRQVSVDADEAVLGTELAEPVFDDRDLVSAMAFSPRGDWLFVAHLGAEMVDVVDAYSMARVGGFHNVGHLPNGLWVSEDGLELWVYAELSREMVIYDLHDPFAPQLELDRLDLAIGRPEPLGDQDLEGKIVFHRSADPRMTATGYMSCASCHLDGDHDGRTWDFTDRGEGVRNTISLLGRSGAVPLHWTANFDELQDFENDIRGPMAGSGFLLPPDWTATSDPLGTPKAGRSEELDAMASWIESLNVPVRSPYRDPDGGLSPDAEAGRFLFESLATRCIECHAPPDYTDSSFQGPGIPLLHDVGTITVLSGLRLGSPLTGFDTPSLKGLHSSAPYLHDGSYDNVRDILADNQATDSHGVTSHLSPEELDQLEAFLLTIE